MAVSEHTLNSVNSIALYQLVYYQIVSISKVKLGTAPEIKSIQYDRETPPFIGARLWRNVPKHFIIPVL